MKTYARLNEDSEVQYITQEEFQNLNLEPQVLTSDEIEFCGFSVVSSFLPEAFQEGDSNKHFQVSWIITETWIIMGEFYFSTIEECSDFHDESVSSFYLLKALADKGV